MLKTVVLHGAFGARFGRRHWLDVASPLDAIRALSVLQPGFMQALVAHRPGFRIVLDRMPLSSREELALPGRETIRIVPVVAGAGGGIGQIFIGVALVVGAFFTGGADLALAPEATLGFTLTTTTLGGMALSFGATLILGGLSQMLAQTPDTTSRGQGQGLDSASYLFNGPVNTTQQGNPVPILYGRLIIGSQVVSASVQAYDIAIAPNPAGGTNSVTWKGGP